MVVRFPHEVPHHIRRVFRKLRVEHTGPVREAAAVGLGLFVGCSPFYGFHLLICWLLASLLRLNRLKASLATNISNPLVAPWLLLAELQSGAWLRHGSPRPLTLEAVRAAGLKSAGTDLLAGSVIVGGCIGVLGAVLTYLILRPSPADGRYSVVMELAAERYEQSLVAWELARARFRSDPIYSAALGGGLLGCRGAVVDIGCGNGFMLALLAEARRFGVEGEETGARCEPPAFERLIGIESRVRQARRAAHALGQDADIVSDQRDDRVLRDASTVLVVDTFQSLRRDDQDALIERLGTALAAGCVIVVRDVDAAAGWWTRLRERLKAVGAGDWRPRHFRSRAEWIACFRRQGFEVEDRSTAIGARPASRFTLRMAADGPASTRRRAPLV
jgi:uncharacterized protein (DUF2062 family)/SAM-dependent methyltransferase